MAYQAINYSLCEIINRLNVQTILDIGCNQGHWAEGVAKCTSKSNIVCIDGNPSHINSVEGKGFRFICACLSDRERMVKFYRDIGSDIFSSGRSYYLENTNHFQDSSYDEIQTKTLDGLFVDEWFDMIKMDIQGAELDAMRGGKALISKCKCLILETATGSFEYNIGSPYQDEVVSWLDAHGFAVIGSLDDLIYNDKVAHQDLLFVGKNHLSLFGLDVDSTA